MFYLTNNKVEFEGHTFIQIKRERPNDEFELGGYVEETLPKIRGEFWVGQNSYVFGDCEFEGKVRVHKNCIIKNSKFYNSIIVADNCAITNSTIDGHVKHAAWFEKGCVVNNRHFKAIGQYHDFFFEDGEFETDVYNGIVLLMTANYCRVNCLTMTYETAWEYLQDEEKWEYIKSKHPDNQATYYPDTKKWLYYWCEKQLKRKQGRAK